jgi:oligopeptide/dipeptide ABC transporter ATP-binding protein
VTDDALLEVSGLTKHFPVTRGIFGRVVGHVRAVDDLSFTIARGETLGLVGESGSGKTTAGRAILRLIEPTSGRVLFDGTDVTLADSQTLRGLRRRMQIVFQDPYASLNPRMRVIDIVGEALEVHGLAKGAEVEKRVTSLLRKVGLSPSWINRYPHEFSGGQRQRLGIARAIALEPKLIVCDEPVSALDVSIQAQVVNLLKDLGRELDLSYLFIAHDLSVVRHVSHRIAVMYLGELVELAPSKRLFEAPAHPYTRALLSAIPVPDPKMKRTRLVLTGDVPSPLNPPPGCRFHTRCPAAFERCKSEEPRAVEVENGHSVKCFHAYDAPHDDWHRVVNERIERATSERSNVEVDRARPALDAAFLRARSPAAGTPPWPSESALRSRRAARFRWLLGFAVIAAIALGILAAREVGSKRRAAWREYNELSRQIYDFVRVTGRYPATLDELGWRLPPLFPNGVPVDPWGNRWVYEKPRGGRGITLESAGPDGVRSDDDIFTGRRRRDPPQTKRLQ